jgi:NADPH:quinone reductase-like Zn-dependent oxidoreductase
VVRNSLLPIVVWYRIPAARLKQPRASVHRDIMNASGRRENGMKLRYKILNGVAAVCVLGVTALIVTVNYDAPCPAVIEPGAGESTMRAVMRRCYGVANLRVEQVAKPVPGPGKVLVKVRASSVNPSQWYGATGRPRFFRLWNGVGSPDSSRLGYDMAGIVEAVGAGVTRFKPGDEVFGGIGGAFAEYAIGPEDGDFILKPANLSFEEAAAIPIAAITALQGLRDEGRIAAGKKVLVNGASGGVGTYAVQLAKAFGAEVTGVCSTRNVEMVRSLGADHVVDYTRQNFTEGTARYDLILDNIGNHGFGDLADVMNPGGVIVIVGASKQGALLGPAKRVVSSKVAQWFVEPRLTFLMADINGKDMEVLAGLAREGKLRSVIDRSYPLAETAAALEYLGTGRARGKVVVTVN